MNSVVKTLLALGLIWGLVAAVMGLAHRAVPTPEKISEYLEAHPLENLAPPARERIIRHVATQINQLDYEQRRQARESRNESDPPHQFFRSLTPAERVLFTELTIGPAFQHLMKALNEMTSEERRKIAADATAQLRKAGGWTPRDATEWGERGEEILSKVAAEGLRAYYEEGSASTKLDLAPVLEEMQDLLQNPHRKWKRK